MHILTGLMNSGKTEIASIYGFKNFLEGRTIYSNYHLNFPHKLINRDYIFYLGKEQPSLDNTCFLLDELWIWLDCRDAKANQIATYFFLQSSKDDANIYITAQALSQNDKRIKDNFHRISFCNRVLKIDGEYHTFNNEKRFLSKDIQKILYIENKEYRKKNSMSFDLEKDFTLRIKASVFFSLYNTKEKIKA